MNVRFRQLLLVTIVLLSTQPARAQRKVEFEQDVVYGHKVGMALTYDVVRPQENANGKGVMFMVSGGWFSGWYPPGVLVNDDTSPIKVLGALVDRGFTLFLVRHGSGEKFQVPDAVDDVRRAALHIRHNAERFGVDPERLGVIGASAGGHLSLMLGTTPAKVDSRLFEDLGQAPEGPIVAAVVAYFPPTELKDYVSDESFRQRFPALQFDAEQSDAVSPLLHVSEDDAPTLLAHGTEDDLVPIKHSQEIHEAFESKGVVNRLLVIEGAGHSFTGDDDRKVTEAALEWFERHLLH